MPTTTMTMTPKRASRQPRDAMRSDAVRDEHPSSGAMATVTSKSGDVVALPIDRGASSTRQLYGGDDGGGGNE